MNLITAYAHRIENILRKDPEKARRMLLKGIRSYGALEHLHHDSRLTRAQRYAQDLAIQTMTRALLLPENTALCSLFVPNELLAAAGITPYSAEAISSFITGTQMERTFLDITDEKGMPPTLCSFHRIFLGAVESGLLPLPPFMVYTNLPCDANMMTFPYLKRKHQMPSFFINVPYERDEESVQDVARQLRNMKVFLEDMTHRPISEHELIQRMMRSNRTAANYHRAQQLLATNTQASHMTHEMYGLFPSRLAMGSAESEKHSELMLRDAEDAVRHHNAGNKLRIAWIHIMPFMQPSMRTLFNDSNQVYVTGMDITDDGYMEGDPEKPYEMMARRMVYSAYNGGADARIESARRLIRETNAEGAVVFNHWGCRPTLGASGLIRTALESDGIPTLVIDGDGCDPSNSSDGQLTTRMEAFMEMLREKRS